MKKEIKFLPIFNPNECNFWDKFAVLYKSSIEQTYKTPFGYGKSNCEINDKSLQYVIDHIQEYHHSNKSFNMVFAAYDDMKLVGCLVGHVRASRANIQYLVVLKDYQKSGIGSQLLANAENAASFVAPKVEITSFAGAESFYKKHRYMLNKNLDFEKNIGSSGIHRVTPVFYCNPKTLTTLSEVSKHPIATIKQTIKPRTPVFIYRNAKNYIAGYGYINDKNEQIVHTRPNCNFAHEQIVKKLLQYKQHSISVR